MTDHTPISSKVSRLDVISTGARRRWTLDEKQRIVAESYSAPRLASVTARRNGLSASQLFTWRRLAREGRLVEAEEATTFAPAIISQEPLSTDLDPCSEPPAALARSPSSTVAIDDHASKWGTGLAGDRPYRHAQRVRERGIAGAGGCGAIRCAGICFAFVVAAAI
jgi:transposase